jgi:hypothetical protein
MTDITDAELIRRSRWHWRAGWLVLRAGWNRLGRRWSRLHREDRDALSAVVLALTLYVGGVAYALP